MDAGEFKKGAKEAEGDLDKLGKRMKKLGANMAKVGGVMSATVTAPLVAFAKVSVDKFQVQEKAIAAVEAALKSMGQGAGFTSKQLQDMASNLQNASTFGDEDILNKVTANMLTFGNVTGEVFERAQQSALDLSARLGQDLQSSTIMLGKALNEPAKGLTALTRVGVSFTEQQKEQIKAMAEAGDVAGAQRLMLSELERQYAGQAKAMADTTGGQMQQLSNAWGDFQEQIGAIVAQVLPPLVDALKGVVSWLQSLDQDTLKWVVGIGAVVAAVGPLLAILGGMVAGIGALVPVIAAVGTGLAALVVASGPIGLFIAAAAAATAAWQLWGDSITALFTSITEFIGSKFTWILEKTTAVTDGIQGAWQYLKDTLVGNSIIPDMVDLIGGEFQRLDNLVTSATAKTVSTLERGYGSAAKSTTNMVSGMANDIKGTLTALFGDSKAASIAQAIISTYTGMSRALELPYPANLAAMAHVAAQGFANVAAIKSTNVGSSSGGGGSAGAAAGAGATAAAAPQQQQSFTINLEGDRFGREQVRNLISDINDAISDGAVIRMQAA
jgi:hypothetical protein